MRKTTQLPLTKSAPKHQISAEYEMINDILNDNPKIFDLAYNDLTTNLTSKSGAKGMTAEQVVKAAIVMQKESFSYRNLAFHIMDSDTFRIFCNIGIGDVGFKKSTLNKNIKRLSSDTWESINLCLLGYSSESEIEKGRQVRIDCTPVSSNVHDPMDSEQLWDCVRVLTRILIAISMTLTGIKIFFTDHTRRAKRRALGVMNAKNEKKRNKKYKDLLKVAKKTLGYAKTALI